ncbi:MAG: DUF89 family protein [Oscillospiraceae bacterium]|nr:DUF89 family protein [Oscillospiraceae bacterium]
MAVFADTRCLLCQLERNIAAARKLGTEEQATAFARDLMKLLAEAPAGVPAPFFTPGVTELFHKHYGLSRDRYRQEKIDSNAFVLARMAQIREKVLSASDPVKAGLQFAILGNYIDFAGLRGDVSFEKLDEMLEKALEMEFDEENYVNLCEELEKGGRLLYLTDNAGEIGFDRIFAEVIAKKYPQVEITFCVRGGPAANDATREDAQAVGIPFPVIDNGNLVPGTMIELLSGEAKKAMDEADVILSKGQGNVETLLGCGYNIYYAFLVKCPLFMERFGKEKLTPMLLKERT